ncbi:MAG TPA: DUF362 domain-containing protein [Bryobacteraceae bacterium]|nr:DUF362 domain-containing protein [Bryobacteraceae bacterium]
MRRRAFLQLAAAIPGRAGAQSSVPAYKIVTPFKSSAGDRASGMPGPYPGKIIRVRSEKCIDSRSARVDVPTVRQMISRGMRSLTGAGADRDAWARFFDSRDVVGIKVNCSGAPDIMSTPEVVAEIVANLRALDIPAKNIYIYERFLDQLTSVHYERYVPEGVQIVAIETPRGSIAHYDPAAYVEVNFFGEDDTRSNLARLVTDRLTKIINVPNLKDHRASGVTGCLKNISYGNFSNVARSHNRADTHTRTFIGTLAAVEPLRSKTVLQVMDGMSGVWHGGPFAPDPRFRFFPKQMMFATDPVAIDRIELDLIEAKRKAEGALSLYDRSMSNIGDFNTPRMNQFIREPGHIEYAAELGLGVYELERIHIGELVI